MEPINIHFQKTTIIAILDEHVNFQRIYEQKSS